jgi:predicted AlkP superfamily phosphohydrolase/phosphomutase
LSAGDRINNRSSPVSFRCVVSSISGRVRVRSRGSLRFPKARFVPDWWDFRMPKKLLIIGWDGADWEIIDALISRGCLPYVEQMTQHGARADLASTIPTHSWTAWSTFLTGKGPGGHGVFDFVETHPDQPGRRIPVSSTSVKGQTFLEQLSDASYELRIGNVPVTFPPIAIRGRMIGGVAIPPGAEFVYPKDFSDELGRRAPFPTNGLEWTRVEDAAALVEEARQLVKLRTAAFEVLLEGDWHVAVCVYVAPDRLQHAMGAYLLPSHPAHDELVDTPVGRDLSEVYRLLDSSIERLHSKAGADTLLVLMSDHGFRPVSHAANLTMILTDLGLAARARTAAATTALRRSALVRALRKSRVGHAVKQRVKRPSTLDWSRTVAYVSAMGGGVSINLKGREEQGIVEARDFQKVRAEVKDRLLAWRDPETGDAPIGRVFLNEEVFAGPHANAGPDLIVQPSDLWVLSHTNTLTAPTDWPTGAHRRRGILIAIGEGIPNSNLGERYIADIPATALAFCGLSTEGLDGRVIDEIARLSTVATPTAKSEPVRHQSHELSEEDQESIAQHLRDLGYIE